MTLDIECVRIGYGDCEVIHDISLKVHRGEILSLLGPNGSGKSTLIRATAGMHKPISGRIAVDGKSIGEISNTNLAKTISYVPQQYTSMPCTTVMEAVLIGRNPYIHWMPSEEDLVIVEKALKTMHIDDLAENDVNKLSGGQKQRVYIARALCQTPNFYLFDEPTSALDLRYQLETMKIMKDIVSRDDVGMMIALHDLNLALRFSDKIAMIKEGELYAYGNSSDVINEKSILDVYGIKAKITEVDGESFMLAFGPCDG